MASKPKAAPQEPEATAPQELEATPTAVVAPESDTPARSFVVVRVRAIRPRWRCGLQFGPEPRALSVADLDAAAALKEMSVDDLMAAIQADPLLTFLPPA